MRVDHRRSVRRRKRRGSRPGWRLLELDARDRCCAQQRRGVGVGGDSQHVAVAQHMRQCPCREHGFAEIGGGEEKNAGHG
jgi:hypothetical protein